MDLNVYLIYSMKRYIVSLIRTSFYHEFLIRYTKNYFTVSMTFQILKIQGQNANSKHVICSCSFFSLHFMSLPYCK